MGETSTDSVGREQSLISDAKYVCDELVRGDAVPGDVLEKAQKLIADLLTAVYSYESKNPPTPADIIPVETALSALMIAIAPVSVQSLKDTQCTGARRTATAIHSMAETLGFDPSELSNADRFSRGLIIFTVVVLFAAIGTTVASRIIPPNPNPPAHVQSKKPPVPPPANRVKPPSASASKPGRQP
jgi:hypothetical protein